MASGKEFCQAISLNGHFISEATLKSTILRCSISPFEGFISWIIFWK